MEKIKQHNKATEKNFKDRYARWLKPLLVNIACECGGQLRKQSYKQGPIIFGLANISEDMPRLEEISTICTKCDKSHVMKVIK